MKNGHEWYVEGLSDSVYQRLLGDPMEIPPEKMQAVAGEFQHAADKLRRAYVGEIGTDISAGVLDGELQRLAQTALEYICGSNPLTQETLLNNAATEIGNLAYQRRSSTLRSARGSVEEDKKIILEIIGAAHMAGMRHAKTPRARAASRQSAPQRKAAHH